MWILTLSKVKAKLWKDSTHKLSGAGAIGPISGLKNYDSRPLRFSAKGLAYLQLMKDHGFNANTITWNMLLKLHRNLGDREGNHYVRKEMVKAGAKDDKFTEAFLMR